MKKVVAFDILGTCFCFDNLIQALDEEFGPEIKNAGTTPFHMMMSWFYATQRDSTYLNLCGQYIPIGKVFASTLSRALARVSFDDTRLVDGFEALWEAGFEVYAVSNGAIATTREYLAGLQPKCKPGIFTKGNSDNYIVSCDEVKESKPSLSIYKHALRKAGADPSKDVCWLVAAHTWDLLSARQAGFKTAYVTFEEIVACEDLFGKPDITEDCLVKAAESIAAATL
ncbi:HAD-like protein [Cystobasidium minutum MCA 4210]|uniref:HAD-like protein n=1 Tax=Cystobasidium minutum MCA 4210 TaxID=1397322 RepID=UPI0034CE0C03|eukprot:jgi/Rhomi1/22964/CE22963_293